MTKIINKNVPGIAPNTEGEIYEYSTSQYPEGLLKVRFEGFDYNAPNAYHAVDPSSVYLAAERVFDEAYGYGSIIGESEKALHVRFDNTKYEYTNTFTSIVKR